MPSSYATSDARLLDLLRKQGPLTIAQMSVETAVTATAVRQRLTRLLAQGDIERVSANPGEVASRGRPVHRYGITEQGKRKARANFNDLALALWQELREIRDLDVRRGLLQRLSMRMASLYAGQIRGSSLDEKMESLAGVFQQRQIPFEVDRSNELPVLQAKACPYPELAEQDRTICSMERIMFSELLGQNVHLSNCRLDGAGCCTFEQVAKVG